MKRTPAATLSSMMTIVSAMATDVEELPFFCLKIQKQDMTIDTLERKIKEGEKSGKKEKINKEYMKKKKRKRKKAGTCTDLHIRAQQITHTPHTQVNFFTFRNRTSLTFITRDFPVAVETTFISFSIRLIHLKKNIWCICQVRG